MKIKILFFFSAVYFFFFLNTGCQEVIKENSNRQLWIDCKVNSLVSLEVFNTSVLGYHKTDNIRKNNTLTIIDYSKPSSEKRFFVIDLEKKQLLFSSLVAHGKNSGENSVTSFSNKPNSLQSSLGFFLTAETYTGENGYSMKLDGLEANINDKARERDIVIHGADYVSQEYIRKYGRLGRSWGCPALPLEVSKEIIDKISNGSCLFIYSEDDFYLKNSNFIN